MIICPLLAINGVVCARVIIAAIIEIAKYVGILKLRGQAYASDSRCGVAATALRGIEISGVINRSPTVINLGIPHVLKETRREYPPGRAAFRWSIAAACRRMCLWETARIATMYRRRAGRQKHPTF